MIESVCKSQNPYAALSLFTAVSSMVLLVSTCIINLLIVITYYVKSYIYHKSMFYKLLLHIVISDLITSVLTHSASISIHLKEALRENITAEEFRVIHISLFLPDGLALITMSLLCVNMILMVVKPYDERKIKPCCLILIHLIIWLATGVILAPYFVLQYIRYLGVFSGIVVLSTGVLLLTTYIIYKKKLKERSRILNNKLNEENTSNFSSSLNHDCSTGSSNKMMEIITAAIGNFNVTLTNLNVAIVSPNFYLKSGQIVKKVSSDLYLQRSLLLMLVVFLVTFIPVVALALLINCCPTCNCLLVHICRDLAFLCMTASALTRPISFLYRLRTLRQEMFNIIKPRKRRKNIRRNVIAPVVIID